MFCYLSQVCCNAYFINVYDAFSYYGDKPHNSLYINKSLFSIILFPTHLSLKMEEKILVFVNMFLIRVGTELQNLDP